MATQYPHTESGVPLQLEVNMILTAKLNLLSGMVLGATAVMVVNQLCKIKSRRKNEKSHTSASPTD